MNARYTLARNLRRGTMTLLTAGVLITAAAPGAAAVRVVLGEYFTAAG